MAEQTFSAKRTNVNCGRLGRETEVKAWLWLTRHGYDVFDNIFPNGPIDLVAVDLSSGTILKLEIRTATERPGHPPNFGRLTDRQVQLGVQMLLYLPTIDDFRIIDSEQAGPTGKRRPKFGHSPEGIEARRRSEVERVRLFRAGALEAP